MDLITYPLNGVTYDAEDVGTYLCTRTSGVYSKDTNFSVSVTGAREITVSPGLAWINYDDFKGVSVCARKAGALTVPDADDTLARIDRVVLQFDADANCTTLKLKQGTPSASPEAPAIVQNHRIYELGLAEITVPAGSTTVTTANITDTRLDEALCGVMSDGVTGIPTAELIKQWNAARAQQEEEARQSTAQLQQELQSKADAQVQDWQEKADVLDAKTKELQDGSLCTKEEVEGALAKKSDTGHTHDERYYQKSEIDALLAGGSIEASGENYIRFTDGTQICWGSIGSKSFEVTGTVHYKTGVDSDGNAVYKDVTKTGTYDANTINFPQPFANSSYSIALQASYGASDASVFNGKSFTWTETKYYPITNKPYDVTYTGTFTGIRSTSPAMGRQATYCTMSNGAWGNYIAVGRWK